jgi:polysaccharide biosynthesis protein PslF
LGVSNRIHWTGYVPAPRASQYLSSLDLYVHTHTAGAATSSGSLVAALAGGLPTIAYRGRETSDLFQDRRNIMLETTGDVDGLVTAVRQLLEFPELRQSISEGAANLYRRYFTWEAIAAQFLEAVA